MLGSWEEEETVYYLMQMWSMQTDLSQLMLKLSLQLRKYLLTVIFKHYLLREGRREDSIRRQLPRLLTLTDKNLREELKRSYVQDRSQLKLVIRKCQLIKTPDAPFTEWIASLLESLVSHDRNTTKTFLARLNENDAQVDYLVSKVPSAKGHLAKLIQETITVEGVL